MSLPILTVHNLRKRYGAIEAIRSVTFDVQKGSIVGLLGPNGAGKTTTLECIEGIREPDGGTMTLDGHDISMTRARRGDKLGVQLQASGLPVHLTVAESLALFGAYHRGTPRGDVIERLGLDRFGATLIRDLSVGQQRKVAIGLALLHQPALVVLDEPTAGLDVESRVEIHQLLRDLRSEGVAILLATHDMREAEELADRVVVLLGGEIIADAAPGALALADDAKTSVSIRCTRCGPEMETLFNGDSVSRNELGDYRIQTTDLATVLEVISARLRSGDIEIEELKVAPPSLEERFINITGGAQ